MNLKDIFQDLNPSKLAVYLCMLIFSLLFSLRLDGTITWSYWVIFLPIWTWKILVLLGSIIGSVIWWKYPQYRFESDGYVQYKAMLICTGLHLLLLMFELLACDKLDNPREFNYWTLVFIPLQVLSIVSVGICIWAVKHERTFELEMFCAVNILQFIFLALKFDRFIQWSWVLVFIPLWILMCIAVIGVLYAIILAVLLFRSPDIMPEQRRSNVYSAVGYTLIVLPMLIFLIILANKLDRVALGQDTDNQPAYVVVAIPLFISLFVLVIMSFLAKGGNHWWFGMRKDFSHFLFGLLREYGNITYKINTGQLNDSDDPNTNSSDKSCSPKNRKEPPKMSTTKLTVPIEVIDAPD